MEKNATVLITGSNGMVGKSLVQRLKKEGYTNLLTPTSKALDLRNQRAVEKYFFKEGALTQETPIDYVFHLAAKVGGIKANNEFPATFLYDNVAMTANLLETARKAKVKKLLNFGSSCIYPRESPQPMKEEYLLTGKPEPTNEGYAIAKIMSLKMAEYYSKQHGQSFINIMPPNLYGPHDHFYSEQSHVVSALMTRMHEAKKNKDEEFSVWGTGKVRREFLYVDDATDAALYFMNEVKPEDTYPFVNIGSNTDVSIKELAETLKEITDYEGKLVYDTSQPEGMPRKLLDSTKAKEIGWEASTKLYEGLKKTYEWFTQEAAR